MRTIWSSSTRPQLTFRLLHGRPGPGLSRGSDTSHIRRRVGFNDFSTVVLGPVLAVAAMAHWSWKDDQRQQWDRRIKETELNIDSCRLREREIWNRIQTRSLRKRTAAQTRSFSSVTGRREEHRNEQHVDVHELNPVPGLPAEWDPMFGVTEGDVRTPAEDAGMRRFQRLIAYRLALQMLVQVNIAGDPKYSTMYRQRGLEDMTLPWDLNQLVTRLREATSELASTRWKAVADLDARRVRPFSAFPPTVELNRQIYELAKEYKTANMKLETLVGRFAYLAMHTPGIPDLKTYVLLIHLFNQVHEEELSYLVLSALHETHYPLNATAIHTVLWRLANSRDLVRFDVFLRDLTKTPGRAETPWEWRRIGETVVPVPSSSDSRMCTRLIAAALSCDQIDRAEAWAAYMTDERPLDIQRLIVVRCFLLYHEIKCNWTRGKICIATALELAGKWHDIDVGSHSNPVQEITMTLLRSMELCIVCEQESVYTAILQATVASGLEPPSSVIGKAQFLRPIHISIVQDWNTGLEQLSEEDTNDKSIGDRIIRLAQNLAPLAEQLKAKDAPEHQATQSPEEVDVSRSAVSSLATANATFQPVEQQVRAIKELRREIALINRSLDEERHHSRKARHHDDERLDLQNRQVTSLQQQVETLGTAVSHLTVSASDITSLQQEVKTLRSSLSNPGVTPLDITSLQREIKNLKSVRLNSTVSPLAIASLQRKIMKLEPVHAPTLVSSPDTKRLEAIIQQQTVTIATMQSQIADLTTLTSNLSSQLESLSQLNLAGSVSDAEVESGYASDASSTTTNTTITRPFLDLSQSEFTDRPDSSNDGSKPLPQSDSASSSSTKLPLRLVPGDELNEARRGWRRALVGPAAIRLKKRRTLLWN